MRCLRGWVVHGRSGRVQQANSCQSRTPSMQDVVALLHLVGDQIRSDQMRLPFKDAVSCWNPPKHHGFTKDSSRLSGAACWNPANGRVCQDTKAGVHLERCRCHLAPVRRCVAKVILNGVVSGWCRCEGRHRVCAAVDCCFYVFRQEHTSELNRPSRLAESVRPLPAIRRRRH